MTNLCPFGYLQCAFSFYNGNCRNRDVYQCGDLDKFIETVMERVESLPAKKIAEVLNGFIEQYGIKIFSVSLGYLMCVDYSDLRLSDFSVFSLVFQGYFNDNVLITWQRTY